VKENPFLTAALAFAQKGTPVFPCRPRSKKPITEHGFKNATTDEKTIREWWTKYPDANVAIPTGKLSGVFVVDADLDPAKGKDGPAELRRLEAQYGPLPATKEVQTPRGGSHRYYKNPEHQTIRCSTGRLAPGIDVKGEGGYVLVPPSKLPKGDYRCLSNGTAPAECPGWLLALVLNGIGKTQKQVAVTPAPARPQAENATEEENRIRDALQVIPAGDYDVWIKIGMALHFWDPTERGFAIWDAWSRKCPEKYHEDELPKKWTSFKNDRPDGVTLGTLFDLAKRGGWLQANAGDNGLLILPSGTVTITQSATKLFQRIAPTHTLFNRGGVVVMLVQDQQSGLALEVIRPSAARSLFEKYARFVAWRAGKDNKPVLKPTTVPEEMARALLESEAPKQFLPRVDGLINCPVIVGDGEIVGLGYHEGTRLLITGGELPPEVPLSEAIESLKELVCEYDFQTPGDRSRALASFITPALKLGGHLKGNVPADVAEADKSQSGKTYRQKTVAAVYNDKASLVTCRAGGVGSVDESLNQQLIGGRPFIQLDNFRGKFDSPHIEALLTAEKSFPARVPHCREVEIDPSRFFVMLTSNGVETTRDFANRSSIVRIKKREGFTFRHYPEGDLLAHIRARQPYYLGCVFAIVCEWVRQGRQRTSETRHDFREWCQTLDWIVQHLLGEAPLMDGHEAAQVRVSNPNLTFLRKLALAVVEQGRVGIPLTASQLYEIADTAGVDVPGLREPTQDRGMRQIGIVMGRLFKDCEAVDTEGFTVLRKETTAPRGGGGTYPSKTYTFTNSAQPAQPAQGVKCQGKQDCFLKSIESCAGCAENPASAQPPPCPTTKSKDPLEFND
jgi:hypothetical protein